MAPRGHVAQQLAPVLDGAVAGHDGGAVLVAAHDYFQEVFAGVFGQGFESHVVHDQEVGLEVAAQNAVLLVEGLMILPKNWTSGLDGALQVKLIH